MIFFSWVGLSGEDSAISNTRRFNAACAARPPDRSRYTPAGQPVAAKPQRRPIGVLATSRHGRLRPVSLLPSTGTLPGKTGLARSLGNGALYLARKQLSADYVSVAPWAKA